MPDAYNGIPRVFKIDTGREGPARFQTPVPRHDLMDTEIDDMSFIYDYETRPRGFNPILYGTLVFRKIRRRAIDFIIGPSERTQY